MNKKIIIFIVLIVLIILSCLSFIIIKSLIKPVTHNAIISVANVDAKEILIKSDIIVVGKVLNKKSFKKGEDIYSNVNIEIERFISGLSDSSTQNIKVEIMGGSIGNETLNMDSYPTFDSNETVLLLLKKINNDTYMPYGSLFGKYSIDSNGNIGKNQFEKDIFTTLFGSVMTLNQFENYYINFLNKK